MAAASRHHERTVVDVATEEQCPAREQLLPHEIRAAHTKRGNPGTTDPIWRCIHCHVTWAELDERTNTRRRKRSKRP